MRDHVLAFQRDVDAAFATAATDAREAGGIALLLREGFGPEYDRVVHERGDQRAGEAELRERRERRRSYDIRPLEAGERESYAERWQATQRRFVDQPASALGEADGLVGEVMSARGYPVEDFEQQAADVSVDHPRVVEHYRAAHAISQANADQSASTEDLRQAMVHYRALFDELSERARARPRTSRRSDDGRTRAAAEHARPRGRRSEQDDPAPPTDATPGATARRRRRAGRPGTRPASEIPPDERLDGPR